MISFSKAEKRINKIIKIWLLVSLTVSIICFGRTSITYATDHSTNDCVTKITNPTYYDAANGYSEYNYVYFGKTDDSDILYDQTNSPILFRVLNTKANNKNEDPDDDIDALLLLCEYDIFKGSKILDDYPYGQNWEDNCDINIMLNDYESEGGVLHDCFTSKEQSAILETINYEITETIDEYLDPTDKIPWYSAQNLAYGSALTGDKLFILSAKEVTNKSYGFADVENDHANIDTWENRDGNRLLKRGNHDGNPYIYWWLRSSSDVDQCGTCITADGRAGYMHINSACGVRFALNIPMTAIVYTSDASNSNEAVELEAMPQQAPSARAICATGTTPLTEYASKLTIKDSSRDLFQVTEPRITSQSEGSFTLNYENAKTNTMEGYDNEYISLIIKDEDGEGLYYGTLKENTTAQDSSGTLIIDLPELDDGNYTLVILNEQRNPAYETNYAGYDTVALTIGAPTTRKAMVTATDDGAGLWKVVLTPSADAEALAYFDDDGGTTQTLIFDAPNEETTVVYIVDKVGNVSGPLTLVTDENPPTGVVSYSDGVIYLNVTDSGSGIARIGCMHFSTYPVATSIPITCETTSVYVEDALGNSDILILSPESTLPTGSNGYRRIDESGETPIRKGIIKATTTGIVALWKVVATNVDAISATPLTTTFNGAGAIKTATFNLPSSNIEYVYVVDEAGNVSEPIQLEMDTEAPTAIVDYSVNPISVTITDSGSGIVRIDETSYPAYTESETLTVDGSVESLEVEDALGNIRTIYIDKTGPTVTNACRRTSGGNTYVSLLATDEQSGLLKVVDSDGLNPGLLYSFTGDDTTQTARFVVAGTSLTTVYVVDKAGNVREVQLVLDNTPPTATRGYVRAYVST